mmetsp:Transcript_34867/g.89528  ORF Transcript_34867/g.89528 Transcript_34867/m.89528 type:complete len:369 (+) Transcript_34867:141-1247(+)
MAAARSAVDSIGCAVTAAAAAPQRPSAIGKTWNEACARVQHSDGSVRTAPPFKSATTSAATSPPRPRRPANGGHSLFPRRPSRGGLGVGGGASSRGGSSRGGSSGKSSRKSSRSSSRDIARDGDISSRCSSGCWETSTNSSEPSRPRTPPDAAQSPFASKGLLMPDPIRTSLILPPALLDDEHPAENKRESPCMEEVPGPTCDEPLAVGDTRPGMPLKWDPYGRDGSRRLEIKTSGWSVEPLAKYLKGVAMQIDANLRDECLPTSERLEAFVSRLVANTQRKLKQAPRKVKHTLQALSARRFQKFWNFARNEKVRATTPEELKWALLTLIENLISEFAVNPDALAQPVAQPKPVHIAQLLRAPDAYVG